MPDYAKIKAELTADPDGLGYAAVEGGLTNHNDLAAMLSSTTGPGSANVDISSLSKDSFLRATAAAAIRCKALVGTDGQALNSLVATAWYEAVVQARAASGLIDLTLVSALQAICGGDPVSVKVMTQVEYDAMTMRKGNRAEVIGAFDSISEAPQTLDHMDIAKALR